VDSTSGRRVERQRVAGRVANQVASEWKEIKKMACGPRSRKGTASVGVASPFSKSLLESGTS